MCRIDVYRQQRVRTTSGAAHLANPLEIRGMGMCRLQFECTARPDGAIRHAPVPHIGSVSG